ncbi:hypothetical protein WJX77_010349 [Trebouxia sp. C0004]
MSFTKLVNLTAAERAQLDGKSFYLDAIKLVDGTEPTSDEHTNRLRLLAVVGCACIGHALQQTEEGFCLIITDSQTRSEFLQRRKTLKIAWVTESMPNVPAIKYLRELRQTYVRYSVDDYYYVVFMEHSDGELQDLKTKQLPKDAAMLGLDSQSFEIAIESLGEFVDLIEPSYIGKAFDDILPRCRMEVGRLS